MELTEVTKMLLDAEPGAYILGMFMSGAAGISAGVLVSLVITGINQALYMVKKVINS